MADVARRGDEIDVQNGSRPATLARAACERVHPQYVLAGFLAGLALCVVGAQAHVSVVYLLGWSLLLLCSVLRPRWGLLALLSVVLFFSEERWQPFLLGGQTGPVPDTLYTIEVIGLKVQWALAGGVVAGGLLGADVLRTRGYRAVVATLLLFLAADVWGEAWGRALSGFGGQLFGLWALIAAPLLVSLAALALLRRRDVAVGTWVIVGLAAARLGFGLVRYAAGRGDWNFELHRRIVFWDSADGFVAVLVAVAGLGLVLRPGRFWYSGRVMGALLLATGMLTAALSFRRQAVLAMAVATIVLIAMAWRPPRRVLLPSIVVVLAVLAAGSYFVATSDGLVASRIRSMNPLDRSSQSATNGFHLADLHNGVADVAQRPWTGWGFHTAIERETDYFLLTKTSSAASISVRHNMYLDVWVRTGVAGFVALCALVGVGWRAGWLARRRDRGPTTLVLLALLTGYATSAFFMPVLNSNRSPYFLVMPVIALVILSAGAQIVPPGDRSGETR